MAECKHPNNLLVGMADGIHCKGCGKIITPASEQAPKTEPKQAPKKNTRKGAK